VAGKSAGVQAKEVSFSEARRQGIKEVTVDKKEFFRPVTPKNPQKKRD
jgi:hypothetical protein